MWFFPWLSYATIALMAAVLVTMAILPATRSQFWLSLVTLAVILIIYEVHRRKHPEGDKRTEGAPTGTRSAAG